MKERQILNDQQLVLHNELNNLKNNYDLIKIKLNRTEQINYDMQKKFHDQNELITKLLEQTIIKDNTGLTQGENINQVESFNVLKGLLDVNKLRHLQVENQNLHIKV